MKGLIVQSTTKFERRVTGRKGSFPSFEKTIRDDRKDVEFGGIVASPVSKWICPEVSPSVRMPSAKLRHYLNA